MKDIAKPLNANTINTSFKVYFNDIGLLTGSFSEDMQKDIFRNFDNKTKGPIFENLLADFLIKSNKYLCYAEKNKQYEIDFVQVINDKISLIDAKAGSSRSQSINKLVNNLIDTVGYKVGNFNYGVNNQIISLPYFAFYFLLTNR
jgi:predicted AAA+ superfamily ATPase